MSPAPVPGQGSILQSMKLIPCIARPLLAALLASWTLAVSADGCQRTASPLPPGPQRLLFVGNSFLHGHAAPVLHYHADRVTDLNGTGYGGVPALFKQLADDAGLQVEVSSELVGGQTLRFHADRKLSLFAGQRWDAVVLQEHSLLDPRRPGDAGALVAAVGRIEAAVHERNASARVYLLETWARADQVYRTPGGRWAGQTLEAMQADLHAGYAQAAARAGCVAGVLPVGEAALRAVQDGVAERDPYGGRDEGKLKLWGPDSYHLSAWGSYLEALVIFGRFSGRDPMTLGADSRVGRDLGLNAAQIEAAQAVASRQLREPH